MGEARVLASPIAAPPPDLFEEDVVDGARLGDSVFISVNSVAIEAISDGARLGDQSTVIVNAVATESVTDGVVVGDVAVDAGSAAWFEENFSTYGTVGDPTDDFRNDINGWYGDWISDGEPNAFIDQADAPPGLGLTQCYRQDQPPGQVCKPGHGLGRELLLPSPQTEIWLEIYAKFSSNYKTDYDDECIEGGANPDHKFIFFGRLNSQEGSTWRYKVGIFGHNYGIKASLQSYVYSWHGVLPNLPGTDGTYPLGFNNIWQRWLFHLRSASSQGVPDGHMEFRRVALDDMTTIHNQIIGNAPTDKHDGFDELELGKTFNIGPVPPNDQHWKYGLIRAWKDDPGWGW